MLKRAGLWLTFNSVLSQVNEPLDEEVVVDWIRASYERSVELDAPELLYHELWKM